ncbi:MAG: hypothetical protein ABFD98_14750 [Syntrophobacteraceae bacterium]|nr:hypothetical protein [Desulfobacteraceae bacterium]
MKAMNGKNRLKILIVCVLVLIGLLSAVPLCTADHRDGHGKHGTFGGVWGRGHDKGNETTGQIVAWGLVAANLTVALSLLLKGIRKCLPPGTDAAKSLSRFNSTQKKYLMQFHYVLNPLILLLAVLHWKLSRCASTALPEWGLAAMGAVVFLGLVLKFKLCPGNILSKVHKAHTQPVLLLVMISMLVFGHLVMD